MAHFNLTHRSSLSHGHCPVGQLCLDHIVYLHELPDNIVFDLRSQFVSEFWLEVLRLLGVSSQLSSAYHSPKNDWLKDLAELLVLPQLLERQLGFSTSTQILHKTTPHMPWPGDAQFFANYGFYSQLHTALPTSYDNPGAMDWVFHEIQKELKFHLCQGKSLTSDRLTNIISKDLPIG